MKHPLHRYQYKSDCRHFIGDRPCPAHKAAGVKCFDCTRYDPVEARLLIIKLGAMGDVLRTTSILPTLREKVKKAHITWITREDSVDLLQGNPLIDSVLDNGAETLARLQVESFDLVINPETSKESASLASLVRARRKKGFGLTPRGTVFPFSAAAEEILLTGLFDDLKQANRKTYEELICRLSEIPCRRIPPALFLQKEETEFAEAFRFRKKLKKVPVVGINTGGGTRWPLKRWTLEGWVNLGKKLLAQPGTQVLLFGGPAEVDINRRILNHLRNRVVDTGCFNPPRQFAALLNLCDVVVTGDSLALHIGLALRKRMVALIGPTSAAEIDLYGRGEKITAEMDCLCCYRQSCERSPHCMDAISPETVFRSVRRQLKEIRV